LCNVNKHLKILSNVQYAGLVVNSCGSFTIVQSGEDGTFTELFSREAFAYYVE